MSIKFICDGCGKEENATYNSLGDPIKPYEWFRRSDKDGRQDACSRPCIERISVKSGKTNLVSPV